MPAAPPQAIGAEADGCAAFGLSDDGSYAESIAHAEAVKP